MRVIITLQGRFSTMQFFGMMCFGVLVADDFDGFNVAARIIVWPALSCLTYLRIRRQQRWAREVMLPISSLSWLIPFALKAFSMMIQAAEIPQIFWTVRVLCLGFVGPCYTFFVEAPSYLASYDVRMHEDASPEADTREIRPARGELAPRDDAP
eukprot:CAMPEP_0170425250 /NCGR_PEP_ID=MMETSP0117_2-20130122/38006_1 /TAXON_ID=400756 /ORGANISM="Durinskia baltica, Strain CSIRO CS-38" /LENGTH=153 /DNA_ID=CAMNT_0010684203 /DNA_START=31 /DNA_END=492 /DNA_ORIENTATION=+